MTHVTPENDRLLTQDELAARWGVTRRYLQKMRRENQGPSYISLTEDGRQLRYKLSDVVAHEEKRRKEGPMSKDNYHFGKKDDAAEA